MTTTAANRKKRSLTDQERYETAIVNDDTDTFVDLIQAKNIVVASVAALKAASASSKNFYLREIKNRMQPEDLRRITNIGDDVQQADNSSIKKRKVTSTPQNSVVEKIVADWPFKTSRVVWTDEFAAKKDEKPVSLAESKQKWARLFAVAEQFCNNASMQSEVFNRIDEIACESVPDKNEKLADKLLNCRQSVRLCFTRLSFIPRMIFTLSSRDENSATPPKTCSFDQLLDQYSIAIPKASNFKGRGPIFAIFFTQHLNTVVFDGTNTVLTKIEYEQGDEEEEEDEVE